MIKDIIRLETNRAIKSYFIQLTIGIIILCVVSSSLYADYKEQTTKTNVNNQTTLFQDSIEGWSSFSADIEKDKIGYKRFNESSTAEVFGSISHDAKEDVKKSTQKLQAIKASDLEAQGRRAFDAEDRKTIFPDDMSVLHKQHNDDAKSIADASGKLLDNLTSKLRDIGMDCKVVEGSREIEPEYYIEINQSNIKNTIYNQTRCEELKNHYSCIDKLSVRCKSKVDRPAHIAITGTNLPITSSSNGYVELGSYDGHWLFGGSGNMFNFYVNFNIVNPEDIGYFRIGSIRYDDFVLIKLNDNYIWSGPFGGKILEMRGGILHYKRVTIDNSGKTYSAEQSTWFHATLGIDMKPYIRSGINILSVKVIVGGKGGILFDLSMANKECAEWDEEWQESGVLR